VAGQPPVPPLIIGQPGDVGFFASEDAVTRHLDPDIADEPYAAFDAEGRRLELVRTRVKKRQLLWNRDVDALAVTVAEQIPTHQAQLDRLLREFLNSIGDPPLVEASLDALIDRAIDQGGYVE
jgi:hypothetical protein